MASSFNVTSFRCSPPVIMSSSAFVDACASARPPLPSNFWRWLAWRQANSTRDLSGAASTLGMPACECARAAAGDEPTGKSLRATAAEVLARCPHWYRARAERAGHARPEAATCDRCALKDAPVTEQGRRKTFAYAWKLVLRNLRRTAPIVWPGVAVGCSPHSFYWMRRAQIPYCARASEARSVPRATPRREAGDRARSRSRASSRPSPYAADFASRPRSRPQASPPSGCSRLPLPTSHRRHLQVWKAVRSSGRGGSEALRIAQNLPWATTQLTS